MFHRQSFILQTTEDCFNFADSHFRSEEHTSELQSQSNLVCRLLLEKKKTTNELFSSTNVLSRPSRIRDIHLVRLTSFALPVDTPTLELMCYKWSDRVALRGDCHTSY